LLRSDPVTHDVPIVVLTESPTRPDQVVALGADAVLVKPCAPEALLLEMDRLLQQSAVLRERGRAAQLKVAEQLERSTRLIERSHAVSRRQTLSRAHIRRDTTAPPAVPPTLMCPLCTRPLRYERSHLGGVNAQHTEQWDYYQCSSGCGEFQYRQRTRKVRRVAGGLR
jgi:CheY-like chemotaxis protein